MNKFLSHIEKTAGVADRAVKFVNDLSGRRIKSLKQSVKSTKDLRYAGEGATNTKIYQKNVSGGHDRVLQYPGVNKMTSDFVKDDHKRLRQAVADHESAKKTTALVAGGAALGAGAYAAGKYSNQEKTAALNQLIEHGVDFDSAVEAIEKEAMLGFLGRVGAQIAGKAKTFATAMKESAPQVGGHVRQLVTGKAPAGTTMPVPQGYNFRRAAAANLMRNKAVQAGAGALGTAGAAGYALGSAGNDKQNNGGY